MCSSDLETPVSNSAAANAKATAATPAAATSSADDELIPHNKLRKQTAAHMVKSVATSPHVLQAVEVDFEAVEVARTQHGEAWKAKEGFLLNYLPFIAKAVCEAIVEFPRINATYGEEALTVHKRVPGKAAQPKHVEQHAAKARRGRPHLEGVHHLAQVGDVRAPAQGPGPTLTKGHRSRKRDDGRRPGQEGRADGERLIEQRRGERQAVERDTADIDRKSTRLNSSH